MQCSIFLVRHLRYLTVSQVFLLSPVVDLSLPPRIKSLDALDTTSHYVSLATEVAPRSLFSTDTNLTKPGTSFPFCLQVRYREWEEEISGEAGSGILVWWRVQGIRTRQGGAKCYTGMDELHHDVHRQPCASQLVPLFLRCASCFLHEDPSEKTSANKHG